MLPMTGALVALIHGVSASCPTGWTPRAGRCYKLTDKSTSALGCVDLCGADASLACIRTAEENAALTALLINHSGFPAAWIGNYQRPGSAQPDGVCPSGEAVDYTGTNWARTRVSDIGGDNAVLLADGGWELVFACLCEYGPDPSPAYLTFLNAQLQSLRIFASIFAYTASLKPRRTESTA